MRALSLRDDCYEKGLLRKVQASDEKAHLSLVQAREWIEEAGHACEVQALRSALIATYMGYFHAARAVLFRDGVREKSHFCIGVYLDSYREKGLLEEEWVVLFHYMRSFRENDQYRLDTRPTLPEVMQALANAERFINRMEQLVKTH